MRVLVLSFVATLVLTTPAHAAEPILGWWEGTSICVKGPWNSACNDEITRYEFVRSDSDSTALLLHAYKRAQGEYVSMGDLEFHRDRVPGRWFSDFSNGRAHVRWTFETRGDSLIGTAFNLKANRLGRNIQAKRMAASR